MLKISRKKTLHVVVYYQLKSCKAVAFELYTLTYLYKIHMFSLPNCQWQNSWYDCICIFLETELLSLVVVVQRGTERVTFL